ncbi:MAG TPA: biopolymer transporter ExbD [Candidatus Limnocylindrales bacterium]|nr:biopolymer transporter ExbD [Candidatus Limnocylindrales bacterium]
MQQAGFYPSRKATQRESRFVLELNLWPFVGVLVVLLLIFMIAPAPRTWTRPTLAAVSHPVPLRLAVREDAMRISIMRDGTLYFGNVKVTAPDIPERIRESVRSGAERRVYLAVDARGKYGDVKVVLDEIRSAGIEKVSFLVGKKRD